MIKSALLTLIFSLSVYANPMSERSNELNSVVDGESLLYTVRLRMLFGKSTWTGNFAPGGASPLRIVTLTEPSCPRSPYANVFVQHSDTKQWEQTNFQRPFDYYSGGSIEAIRFDIDQPWYGDMTCTFKVYTQGQILPPPTPNETLVGVINYEGGFGQNLSLNVKSQKLVTSFRVKVPSFCKDLEILEAFTITEGVKDKATAFSATPTAFKVNEGHGSRISAIELTVLGPEDSKCQLPIYATEKEGPREE